MLENLIQPNPSKQERIREAYALITDLIECQTKDRPYLGHYIWQSACIAKLVGMFKESGLSYNQFCKEVDNAKIHYKEFWKHEEI